MGLITKETVAAKRDRVNDRRSMPLDRVTRELAARDSEEREWSSYSPRE